MLGELLHRIVIIDPKFPELDRLRSDVARRASLIDGVAENRREIMAFDHMEAKAKSRAIRTRETCVKLLADIESGKADSTTQVMKFAIQTRWKEAQEHISKIDAALLPYRQSLKEAAKEIKRREEQVVEIDIGLEQIMYRISSRIESGANLPVQTPPSRSTEAAVPPPATVSTARPTVEKKDSTRTPSLKPNTVESMPIGMPTIAPLPSPPKVETALETGALDPVKTPLPRTEETAAPLIAPLVSVAPLTVEPAALKGAPIETNDGHGAATTAGPTGAEKKDGTHTSPASTVGIEQAVE